MDITFLTLVRVHSKCYCTWYVCLSVCVTTIILALQATKRPMSPPCSFRALREREKTDFMNGFGGLFALCRVRMLSALPALILSTLNRDEGVARV